jgi:hypothetical protein
LSGKFFTKNQERVKIEIILGVGIRITDDRVHKKIGSRYSDVFLAS